MSLASAWQWVRARLRYFATTARSDRHTLPPADPRVERLSRIVAWIASLWFALVAAWEIAGPFGAGHYAAGPAFAVAAENSLEWGIIEPIPAYYTLDRPRPDEYYCHHPFGFFWVMAAFLKVLGHHDWVVRAPAVLMSAATPPLLYAIGRAIWGPIAGAVAAASFATLPIALAYANLSNLEVPTIFGVLVTSLGYVRYTQTWRKRWLVFALSGLTFGLFMDWPAYFFAASLLAFLAVRGFLLPRLFPPLDARGFARFWALASCVGVGVLLLHLYWFGRAGQLHDFLAGGTVRSSGVETPLSHVLWGRRYWIEISFTPLAIAIGKLMLPLFLVRLLVLRRDLEVLPLAVLTMATVHYVVFKNGADVHVFWSHYFAPYFALAMAGLVATLEGSFGWCARFLGRFVAATRRVIRLDGTRAFAHASLVLGLSVPLLIVRDGVTALVYSRVTGGRFDQKGMLLHPDKDKVAFVEWLSPRMESRTGAVLDRNMKQSFWVSWSLGRPLKTGPRPPSTPATGVEQYYLLDSRFSESTELERLARTFKVTAVGPFWAVDRGAPHGPIDGYDILRREPEGLEWYLRSGVHALREVVADPFVTWELRDHLGQTPNPEPSAAPRTDEQLRIAHNLALSRGDVVKAESLRARLLASADRKVATRFSDGTALLGLTYREGASRVLTLYFEAGEPAKFDYVYEIRSRVTEKLAWSMVPADEQLREVGLPAHLPRRLWKPGYLYSSVTEILKRPGKELFFGAFRGKDAPRAVDRREPVVLLELE